METSETVAITADRLKGEISKITCQVERLDDVALSVGDAAVEEDLRVISAEIRRLTDAMRNELEPDEPWLAG